VEWNSLLGPAGPDPEGRVRALTCRHQLLNLKLNSPSNQKSVRRGTRISVEVPITISSLDPAYPFSEPCPVILVNPQGCAALAGSAVLVQLSPWPVLREHYSSTGEQGLTRYT
jgi:hypothetical protein